MSTKAERLLIELREANAPAALIEDGTEPEQRFWLYSGPRHGLGFQPAPLDLAPGVSYQPDFAYGEDRYEIKGAKSPKERACPGCRDCGKSKSKRQVGCKGSKILRGPSCPSFHFVRRTGGGALHLGTDQGAHLKLLWAAQLYPQLSFYLCWPRRPDEGGGWAMKRVEAPVPDCCVSGWLDAIATRIEHKEISP